MHKHRSMHFSSFTPSLAKKKRRWRRRVFDIIEKKRRKREQNQSFSLFFFCLRRKHMPGIPFFARSFSNIRRFPLLFISVDVESINLPNIDIQTFLVDVMLGEDLGDERIEKDAWHGVIEQTARSGHQQHVARAKKQRRWNARRFLFAADEKNRRVAEREREKRMIERVHFGIIRVSAQRRLQMVVIQNNRFGTHRWTTWRTRKTKTCRRNVFFPFEPVLRTKNFTRLSNIAVNLEAKVWNRSSDKPSPSNRNDSRALPSECVRDARSPNCRRRSFEVVCRIRWRTGRSTGVALRWWTDSEGERDPERTGIERPPARRRSQSNVGSTSIGDESHRSNCSGCVETENASLKQSASARRRKCLNVGVKRSIGSSSEVICCTGFIAISVEIESKWNKNERRFFSPLMIHRRRPMLVTAQRCPLSIKECYSILSCAYFNIVSNSWSFSHVVRLYLFPSLTNLLVGIDSEELPPSNGRSQSVCGTGTKINRCQGESFRTRYSDCLSVDTWREERRIDLHLIVNRRMLASFTRFSFADICGKRDDAVIEMQM